MDVTVIGPNAAPISLTHALIEFGLTSLFAALPLRFAAVYFFTPKEGLRGAMLSAIVMAALQFLRGNALDVSIVLGAELGLAYYLIAHAHLRWLKRRDSA